MIRISDITLPLAYNQRILEQKICNILNIERNSLQSAVLYKLSVDARKKTDIHFNAAVDVQLTANETQVISRCKNTKITAVTPYTYILPEQKQRLYPPVIIGAGPAGLFAGLILAQAGAKPVIIERGRDVDARSRDVETFWTHRILDTNSNVQFGEGGAGTFSDGKLNTGTKDIRARKVLQEFVNHGAPREILYNAKPHIGTDYLKTTVKNIRKEIIRLGGTVLFETKLVAIKQKDQKICGITTECAGKYNQIETDAVILAVGHSARDTFEMIHQTGIPIEQKSFSIGARIEHLREMIDKSQYGKFAGNKALGAASYKLNCHLPDGKGVYTFCMCPGGQVVAAASEEHTVVTNGMSNFAREAVNSNAALLVGIAPKDFNSDHTLAGMYLQREIEHKAYIAGGGNYNAPVQRIGDFLKGTVTKRLGEVTPSYAPGYTFADMGSCLPEAITQAMKAGITHLNSRLHGFAHPDGILTGVETRSSSPIRILRDSTTMESIGLQGLYPCGEGAGYAGGIISAAVDGIKCAEKILMK